MVINRRTAGIRPSPIEEVQKLVSEYDGKRRVMDLSQGLPAYGPAPEVLSAVAEILKDPKSSSYAPRAGLNTLRAAVASAMSVAYPGRVDADQILITAGCNQAFCATVSTIADKGDEMLVALPHYFNHEMWLQIEGIRPVHLETNQAMEPDPAAAAALITDRTRAIVLVSPGNPSGVTIGPATLAAFADLAREAGLYLILDETYHAFSAIVGPAHRLFDRHDWPDYFISLRSFSKEYALPGYRVGAVIAGSRLLGEILKVVECMAVCAPRIGQEAAIAALREAGEWRRRRVSEVLAANRRFTALLAEKPGGFELLSGGAFYAWVRHPVKGSTTRDVVARLIQHAGLATLDGTLFMPRDEGCIRFTTASVSSDDVSEVAERLMATYRRS